MVNDTFSGRHLCSAALDKSVKVVRTWADIFVLI